VNAQKALGYLIAGHINHVFAMAQDREVDCCPGCCSSCAALVWYRDNASDDANMAVISLMMDPPTTRYDWQDPVTLDIDWSAVGECWSESCPFTNQHEERP
jgi:hypothetical protein